MYKKSDIFCMTDFILYFGENFRQWGYYVGQRWTRLPDQNMEVVTTTGWS